MSAQVLLLCTCCKENRGEVMDPECGLVCRECQALLAIAEMNLMRAKNRMRAPLATDDIPNS